MPLTPQQMADFQRLRQSYAPVVEAQRRKQQAQANLEKMHGQPPVKPQPKADGGSANLDQFLEGSHTPMRLYHGTTATEGGKRQEAVRRLKPSKEGAFGPGVYMTPDTEYANEYTGAPNKTGGNMLPLHAKIMNPLVVDMVGPGDPNVMALMAMGVSKDKAYDIIEKAYEKQGGPGKHVYSRAKALGHDAMIVKRNGKIQEVVHYNPKMIKSAIGNRGTYDTTKDDLSMAKGGKIEVRPTVFDDAASRRNPKIEEAARALLAGNIKQKDYEKLVAKEKPVKPYSFIPKPATDEQAMDVLLDRQKQNWRSHESWPAGHRVGLRLDIPAYERHGVWVNSVHDESGEKPARPTSYGPVSSVRNAEFQGSPNKAARVATGELSKAPFARIMGDIEHMNEDQAVKHFQKYMNHPDYRQIGYDPRRHGDFYDRETMQPVTHAEHVVQIGPLVLAKKPKYGKRTVYDKGGSVSDDPIANYKDPSTTKISDWKWRQMQDVRKDVPVIEVPDYIQKGYGQFMNEQLAKAKTGNLSPRDLLKAFTITQSSIGRGGLPHSTATKTGMKLPMTSDEVRPEGAFAEWLGSKMGQNYLNAAERGQIHKSALKDIQQKFAPFGKHNQLIGQMIYAAQMMPTLAKTMNQAVTGGKDKYRDWAEQMKGIAGAKSGFIGSMLGRGDLPTLDARQLNLHTLPANVGIGSIMNRGKGTGAREAVDRLASRQQAMNLKLDPSMAPHYQHLAHHAVWDAMGKNKTTHDDLVRAMRGYAKGGKVTHAHHLEIEERPL